MNNDSWRYYPYWLHPYCTFCQRRFRNMREYLAHLHSASHYAQVRLCNSRRDSSLLPHDWQLPDVGDIVDIHWGQYRNHRGQILRRDMERASVDLILLGEDAILVTDIPLYGVVRHEDWISPYEEDEESQM